jgi:hypothetical protein
MQLAQDRHELDVFEYVLALDQLKAFIFEWQRDLVEVVDHIDARKRREVEVHPSLPHVRPAADVQALHEPRLYA